MIDLQKASGLPIALEDTRLVFGKDLAVVEPSKRTMGEMKPFLLNGRAEFQKPVAYYILEREGKPEPHPNKLYGSIPKPQILKPKDDFLDLSKGTPPYAVALDGFPESQLCSRCQFL